MSKMNNPKLFQNLIKQMYINRCKSRLFFSNIYWEKRVNIQNIKEEDKMSAYDLWKLMGFIHE
jgi:hypothetical protein